MIISIIILIVIITAIIILKPNKEKERITLSLKELSPIWTKYNEVYGEVEVSDNTDAFDGLFGDFEKKPETRCESSLRVASTRNETKVDKSEQITTSNTNTHNKVQSFFIEPLKSFWENCIQPYKDVFESQNVSDVVKELIEILEKHGHCPSVVIDKKDSESIDLISVRDNLAQVNLKEHTYAVARNLVEIIKNSYMEYENHIPKAVITALAHDIGKIPEFRLSRAYNTYEHHLVSANKLMELFAGKDIFWVRQAVKAVENHHIHTSDDFTILLKQADRQARQVELLRFTKNYSIISFEEWFKVGEFYKNIEPHINYIQSYKKWVAFTFKGIVYCKPDFLYGKTKELCRVARALDLTFTYDSEKENALRLIVSTLRKANMIPDLLKPNQYTRKFEVKTQIGKQKYVLTPLKCNDSLNLQELESRKTGFLEIIERVIPC